MTKSMFALLGGLVAVAGLAAQSKPSPLVGVWQAVEVTMTGPVARTITIPEPRPNLIILTPKYYSRVEVHAEGPRPLLPEPATASADQLRATWGPFVGEAGTYEVNREVITMRPISARDPAAMAPGAFIAYTYRLEGQILWVTHQRNQAGALPNPATIKLVRVE